MANRLHRDLTGKYVVVRGEGPRFERILRCERGFGCRIFTAGTAIMGTLIKSGRRARVCGITEIEELDEHDRAIVQGYEDARGG